MSVVNRFRLTGSLWAGLLLSACATGDAARLSEEPGYVAGYGDGCATGAEHDKSFSTKTVRDDRQFESDKAYRAGWRQGYLSCGQRASLSPDGGRVLGEEGRN